MSVIIQQPDALSFSGNLKPFEITSSNEITFELYRGIINQGPELILSEKYQPDANGFLSVNLKAVIERLLTLDIPVNMDIVTEQPHNIDSFIAVIDGTSVGFTVIKGGVAELQETAASWLADHWMTWQPQAKTILQTAPEWLGIYPVAGGTVRLKAYYTDGTNYTGDYAVLPPALLYSINTSWSAVNLWLISKGETKLPVTWDVWFEVAEVQTIPVQRYQLRNSSEEEHVFVWTNTLGGIDSASFTGSNENDQKLTHQIAEYNDETIGEYDIDQAREIKQSTGYLNTEESRWLQDFFVSRKKYLIRADGSLKAIAVVSSKIISISADDGFDYEFTYRFGDDTQLLNLERTLDPLPAPEGLADFFLTELLSGLTEALYQDNLLIAVQSPFTVGWQKLSLAQLRIALLRSISLNGVNAVSLDAIKEYLDGLVGNGVPDTRTIRFSGAVVWRSGLTFDSTKFIYMIVGEDYQISPQVTTLDDADPDFARIDVFFLDTSSILRVLKGVPGAVPVKPEVEEYQIEVYAALITAGATEPSITVDTVYDEKTAGEWTASEGHDTDIAVYLDATTDPDSGLKHIEIELAIPDTTIATPTHYLGEEYKDGIIFHLYPGGKKGKIVSKTDVANGVWWASLSGGGQSTGGRGTAIGTGQANSTAMLAQWKTKDHAVKFCDQLVIGTTNNCYLPSRDELLEIYFRRFSIPGMTGKMYWSSTEHDYKRGISVNFANGVADYWDKNRSFDVRAIWDFDDTLMTAGDPVLIYTPTATILNFSAPEPIDIINGTLIFRLKSSVEWLPKTALKIKLFSGELLTGHLVISVGTGLHGYNSADSEYQMVAIPAALMAMTANMVDKITFELENSWPNGVNLRIDRIRIQHDTNQVAIARLTQGVYGSDTKHVAITVDAQGKITEIEEIDVTDLVQILSGLTPAWDVVNGIHATLTLSGNTTITLSNLVAGMSGNLTVTNPTAVYTLTIAGYTNKISPAIYSAANKVKTSGASKIDVFSWYYDGEYLFINGTNDYK